MVKNPPVNAGAVGEPGLIPGSGRFPRGGKWLPTPVFLPGKSHGQRSLMGYSPYNHRESDMTEKLSMHAGTHTHTHTHTHTLRVGINALPDKARSGFTHSNTYRGQDLVERIWQQRWVGTAVNLPPSFPMKLLTWGETHLEEITNEQHFHSSSAQLPLPSTTQLESLLLRRILTQEREMCRDVTKKCQAGEGKRGQIYRSLEARHQVLNLPRAKHSARYHQQLLSKFFLSEFF